jgi:hypothetical protein
MNRKLSIVSTVALYFVLAGAQRAAAADFKLGWDSDSCGGKITGAAGDTKTFDVFATLTTSNNTSPDGAQGWSLSVEITGGTIDKVSLKGVTVSTIFDEDDDGDPDTPPIHHDPFTQDLGAAEVFTKIANKATFKDDATRIGAISAVVMRSAEKMVLQPSGKQQVLKVSCSAKVPSTVVLSYVNGFKSSVSQPVNNVITFGGASVPPTTESCTISVEEPVVAGPEFSLAVVEPGKPAPATGDSELTGQVDAGDVIVPVDVLLGSSGLAAGSDGPQGWSLSIANDACMTINKVTLKGVTVSTIYCQDEDGDPDTACIVHDPFIQDLGAAEVFTKIANKATGEAPSPINNPNQAGVISAVVLRSQEKMVLHANASDTILRIEYKIAVETGKTTDCKAFFLDGLKSSVSQPVNNVITESGKSVKASGMHGLSIKLTGKQPEQGGAPFKSGDANNDGKFNIADAVRIIMAVIPSIGPPLPCPAAGDVDANGRLELPDAIYVITWQFQHGAEPKPPFPACATRAGVQAADCPTSYVCTQ